MKLKLRKRIRKFLLWICALALLGAAAVLGINGWVVHRTAPQILTVEEASKLTDVDCILVLGCGVYGNGQPTAMLADRLERSVELYKAGASGKLLMSGDHGQTDYDEVNVMRRYALEQDIPSEDVFMDHAGFSTYESLYRAKEIFCAKKIVIVTQEYHLHRALYVAKALGLQAYGVSADYRTYGGQSARDLREILARNKDFLYALFQPKPTFLGDTIPVSGDGNLTVG